MPDCYYKVRQVLQSVTVITNWDGIEVLSELYPNNRGNIKWECICDGLLYSRKLLKLLWVFHHDNNDNTKNDNMKTTKTN